MSHNFIFTQPYTSGPYFKAPIPGTYPPQMTKLPVNGTSYATMPATMRTIAPAYHYPATVTTPWFVYPNTVAPQRQIWYHGVSTLL